MSWFDENAPADVTAVDPVADPFAPGVSTDGANKLNVLQSDNTGINGGATSKLPGAGFESQIEAALRKANPGQSDAWIGDQVKYYVNKKATESDATHGDDYWLMRAGLTPEQAAAYGGGQGQFNGTAPEFNWDGQSAQFNPTGLGQLATLASPQQVNPGTINAPDAPVYNQLTAGQATGGASVIPSQYQAQFASASPAVQAQMLKTFAEYKPVTESELTQDPSYKFRVSQANESALNNAAARGTFFGGNTLSDLSKLGSDLASQEYAAADARKFRNYSTAADDAFRVGSTNAGNALSADTFNAGQANQIALANAAAANQAGQFNAGQTQNANLFNSGQATQNNQFNVGQSNSAQSQNAGNALQAYGIYAPLSTSVQGQNIGNLMNAAQQNNAANLGYANYGLGAQQQNYAQQLGVFGANQDALNAAFNRYLGGYNAGTNAALGYGNLNLGYNNFGLNSQNQAWNQWYTPQRDQIKDQQFIVSQGNPNGGA